MPTFNIVDEAVIDSDPITVFQAIFNELSGVTHWWMPHSESTFRGNTTTINQPGAIIDSTIHSTVTSRFSERFIDITPNKRIQVEIFEGDFLGNSEWIFEPIDSKTKVKYHWNARTNRLLFTLLSPFVNIRKLHSEIMQQGFKALNHFLNQA
jgi:hypothetical protein